MTKEDIKKALEFCAKDHYYFCGGCSYDDVRNCNDKLKADALNVIIEQEKEIERLKTTLGQCNTELNSALESLKSECREIGKLRAEVKQAQIGVLNKAKEKFNAISRVLADDGYIDADIDGIFAVSSCRRKIDELIKEVENDK